MLKTNSQQVILSIDQGTTSSRVILFAIDGSSLFTAQQEFPQIYPDDAWVEHDPEMIWQTVQSTVEQAISYAEEHKLKIMAMGITNQRETTVVWDKKTGKAIYNAIVWQDRRTSKTCAQLKELGLEPIIQDKTGLLLDPYFSATKVSWILDHVDNARDRAMGGDLAFGTIDSFLIYRLSDGQNHVTDATNASRTSLFNIVDQQWDQQLLDIFDVPEALLPKVLDSADNFGIANIGGQQIPILGVAGDQQAAAIGQCCFTPGSVKSTYGTGCFVLVNTGREKITSTNKLLTTVAYRLNGETTYAIEGSIFIAGAAVQWLRDELQIIETAEETEAICSALTDNSGLYLVPAFTGLGAPYWQPDARGALLGITRATGRNEIVRAAIESVCYQTHDLLKAIRADGINPVNLKVDGGMVHNQWFLQFLADVLDLSISRPQVMETTALGVAYLAGLKAGIYSDLDELQQHWQLDKHCEGQFNADQRDQVLNGWKKAVKAVLMD